MKEKTIALPYMPRYPQDEIHEALDTHRFVVLVAHRRMGKTVCVINQLIKKALLCRRKRGFFGYVAPFRNQAKAIAWGYLKQFTSPLPDRRINESELCVTLPGGAAIRVFGADNPDALRGLYFDGVVLDEVAQMKPEVWSGILRPALADRKGWAVFIGTPKGVNLFHELYEHARREAATGNSTWHAALYRADETRVIPEEELEAVRAELADNVFRQEFLCDFTAASDNGLIPVDLASAAARRQIREQDVAGMPVVAGVDVARFGPDATVFMRRQGLCAFPPVILRGLDNMAVADRLASCIAEWRPDAVFVDAGGGAGVIDRLRRMGHRVTEAPFGGRALQDRQYVNRRAEMWCAVRDWLRAGGAIPDLRDLKTDLSTPVYSFDAAGRLKLESKEEIRRRLGRSPDLADALALTFYAPVALPGSPAPTRRAATTRPAFQKWR